MAEYRRHERIEFISAFSISIRSLKCIFCSIFENRLLRIYCIYTYEFGGKSMLNNWPMTYEPYVDSVRLLIYGLTISACQNANR